MAPRNILITGATGQQGRALIAALRPQPDAEAPFHVLALTRSATKPAAKKLALEKHVTIVEGNMMSVESTRKVFQDAKDSGGVWGVFCVIAFPGLGAVADGEEQQGKTVADLSLEFGASVFIYSSIERRGDQFDDEQKFSGRAKVNIERHVRQLGEKGLPWTILRPAFFMENYDGKVGSITVGVLKVGLKPTTAVALIAAADVGLVAAGILEAPELYKFRVLVAAGDSLTMSEQEAAYEEATGRSIPSIPGFLSQLIITTNRHTKALITSIELRHEKLTNGEYSEYEAQVALAREAYPMRTFKAWAEERNGMAVARAKNWNNVSIAKLVAGKQ